MIKAWTIGVFILIAVCAIWFILMKLEIFSQSFAIGLWASPAIAAFVTSYLAPARKFVLGISMAAPTALLAVLINTFTQFSGHAVDFAGPKGGIVFFVLVLMGATILSAAGGLAGYFVSKK